MVVHLPQKWYCLAFQIALTLHHSFKDSVQYLFTVKKINHRKERYHHCLGVAHSIAIDGAERRESLKFEPPERVWAYYNGSYQSSTAGQMKRERAGGGQKWDGRRLLLRLEYICGKTAGVEGEGVYAVAAYSYRPLVCQDGGYAFCKVMIKSGAR